MFQFAPVCSVRANKLPDHEEGATGPCVVHSTAHLVLVISPRWCAVLARVDTVSVNTAYRVLEAFVLWMGRSD